MLGHRAIGEAPVSALATTGAAAPPPGGGGGGGSAPPTQPPTPTQTQRLTARFASQSFVTRATDTPAHTYIGGRINNISRVARRITSIEGGQFGSLIESDIGDIELVNNDGGLDYLLDYFADGRVIKLKVGSTEVKGNREQVKPFSTFATVFTSVAGEWSVEHDIVRLRIRDLSNRLKDRLQQLTYSGTGGKNGTADMAGRTKPTAFGRCANVKGQLVDPTIFTIQLHGGTMDSISRVNDRGVTITDFDGDFPTYNALAAAGVSPAGYASCLDEGFIKVGGLVDPTGVTADIRGDNKLFDVRGYTDSHAAVIKKILLNYAGFTVDELDVVSFDVLDGLQPGSMGIFLPAGDQSTVEEVIEQIALSAGAFAGQDRSGIYRVQRLEAPKAKADWIFTDRDIIRSPSGQPQIERLALPYTVAWNRWGVGFNINWTLQTGADLATGVSQTRRQFLEAESRFVYASDTRITNAHLTSSSAPLRRGLYTSKREAELEAKRLIEFYSLERALYKITIKTALFSVEIGQTVTLIYDRWNLAGGQNFVVVDVLDNASTIETELILFGSGKTIPYSYDIYEAMSAKANNDSDYFHTVLTQALTSTGVVTDVPVPPSQRNWTAIPYPALVGDGQQARNVLIPPAYPLDQESDGTIIPWGDPSPSSNQPAAFLGLAPDGSPAIEIRYTVGQSPQFITAYIPFRGQFGLISGTGIESAGVVHAGISFEVWNEAGFDWGVQGTGGKLAAGLWGGRRPAAGGALPPNQGGISMRNIWSKGSGTTVHARGYGYVLNRPGEDPDGLSTGQVQNKWLTGQWQKVEYEGFINTPGFVDGYARMWIGNECVAEITRAVWAVAYEWLWRGFIFSDAWQDGAVPKAQKRWIRNMIFYHPS